MDNALLNKLGLDASQDLKGLLEELEAKQYEFFERLETTNDETRKEELTQLLSGIDQAIGEIKDQLASLDSAIILDTGDASEKVDTKAQQEQEQKAQKKAQQAQLDAKVKDLKEKEEARQQQEKQAAEEAAQQPDPAPAAPVQQPMSDLQQGLIRYHNHDYSAAFIIFHQLAEQNDATAQYMLASMYHRGEGTSANHERAEFWMKKSADNGDPVAQFDFAVFQLSDSFQDKAKIALGMQYMKRSAENGHRDAMDKFVDLAQKNSTDAGELKAAQECCSKLMDMAEDSYDKQVYDQTRHSLKIRLHQLRRINFGCAASSVLSIIGALMLMLVTLLTFANFHQDFLGTLPFFRELPQPLWLMLSFDEATIPDLVNGGSITVSSMSFLMMLVAVGWFFKGASCKDSRNTLAIVIVRIGVALRYITIVGHLVLCAYLSCEPFDDFLTLIVSIALMVVIGRVLGWILGKILGTKPNWSKLYK